ncbi:MAG TPA: LamG-like jellyroll fold domain-containing protein [Phycisphaerales bacterium]|nr:LamG-like jellyroll fold domain-containing protein [Phycisphaerales bacterium]
MRSSPLAAPAVRTCTPAAIALLALSTAAHAQSFGNALSFDLDDQVTCVGDFNLTSFTIEAWIFVRDYGPAGYGGICAWGRQEDASYEIGVLGLNGKPEILVTLNLGKPGYRAFVQDGLFELNQWSHIAITYDQNFINFYRNGVFVNSIPLDVPIQPGGQNAVFALSNLFTGNDQHSDLAMDEFRIWNIARTEEEIRCSMSRTLPVPQAGLMAYYPFDESSGPITPDISGNGRDGLLGLTAADEINDPARVASTAPAECFNIVSQPDSLTQCSGGVAVLEFAVCGVEPLQFQWRKNGENIQDANLSVLTITNLNQDGAATYDCVVTSTCGQVTSDPATVSVCGADFDCSGFVDTDDFSAFVSAFEAGDEAADFDDSGFVDTDDFTAFVTSFEAGC